MHADAETSAATISGPLLSLRAFHSQHHGPAQPSLALSIWAQELIIFFFHLRSLSDETDETESVKN